MIRNQRDHECWTPRSVVVLAEIIATLKKENKDLKDRLSSLRSLTTSQSIHFQAPKSTTPPSATPPSTSYGVHKNNGHVQITRRHAGCGNQGNRSAALAKELENVRSRLETTTANIKRICTQHHLSIVSVSPVSLQTLSTVSTVSTQTTEISTQTTEISTQTTETTQTTQTTSATQSSTPRIPPLPSPARASTSHTPHTPHTHHTLHTPHTPHTNVINNGCVCLCGKADEISSLRRQIKRLKLKIKNPPLPPPPPPTHTATDIEFLQADNDALCMRVMEAQTALTSVLTRSGRSTTPTPTRRDDDDQDEDDDDDDDDGIVAEEAELSELKTKIAAAAEREALLVTNVEKTLGHSYDAWVS